MLNFRTVNIVFLIVLVALAIVYFAASVSIIWFFVLLWAYSTLIFYGSFFVGSQFYMKVKCNAGTKEKLIALTFDDGPSAENTPAILDVLKECNVKAAFFCIGSRIEGNEELIKRIDAEGHVVANHSWSHSKWIDFFTAERMENEINETKNRLFELTGKTPRFFRPPFGITNPAISRALKKTGNLAIGWDVRSLDTHLRKDKDAILERIASRLKPGSIVLLHDLNPNIPYILRKLFDYLEQNGYRVERPDKLLNEKAYE